MLNIPRVSAAAPILPALKSPPAEVLDAGTLRLGSGCITGKLPARKAAQIKALFVGASLLALGACSAQQQQSFTAGAASIQPALQTACTDAMAIANIAGLVPGVGAIVPYINAGCGTAEGLVKLAADPTSTEWVGTLSGQIKTLAGAAGIKIAKASKPATQVLAFGPSNEPALIYIPDRDWRVALRNIDSNRWPAGYSVTITKSGAVLDGALL